MIPIRWKEDKTMIRLLFIGLALFGLYMVLGTFFPVVFQTGFFIPTTKIYLSYLSVIMLLVGAYSFSRLSFR
jgi:hypothetical protein